MDRIDNATAGQVRALTLALRTMRKQGFTLVQDSHGQMQSHAEQVLRARIVAADMLDVALGEADESVFRLALEIVQTANAARGLRQFASANVG